MAVIAIFRLHESITRIIPALSFAFVILSLAVNPLHFGGGITGLHSLYLPDTLADYLLSLPCILRGCQSVGSMMGHSLDIYIRHYHTYGLHVLTPSKFSGHVVIRH